MQQRRFISMLLVFMLLFSLCSITVWAERDTVYATKSKELLIRKTESGAEIAARLFTIVQTAKANGLIPEKYIEWCIESSDRPADELLPWSKHVPDGAKALKGKL